MSQKIQGALAVVTESLFVTAVTVVIPVILLGHVSALVLGSPFLA